MKSTGHKEQTSVTGKGRDLMESFMQGSICSWCGFFFPATYFFQDLKIMNVVIKVVMTEG